jgi:hypothetical protein
MKKFLAALFATAIIIAGCAIAMPPTEMDNPLPAHIQRIENIVNDDTDGPYFNFVDYRDTDSTVWIWVDNYDQPGDCNFVIVLGVVNKDTDDYVALLGFTERNSPDPCGSGYQAFEEYKRQVEAGHKKKGI